jgi:Flp pilus assembly protein TadG
MSLGLRLTPLARDSSGVSVVEFALVAPVLLLLLFGMLELGYQSYARTVLEGAVQEAGRDSGLESGLTSQRAIDDLVKARITALVPEAAVSFARANYGNFADVNRPEDFTDTNANGRRDATECFTDENDNGAWDGDVGRTGQGGANDVVLYTVRVSYPSFLPIAGPLGLPHDITLSASTILRNQPFATQAARRAVGICP